ncbi:hypothetical protein [Prauserella alba]|uniref:Uncharacterized protein n=1 Tax=Prauserella alba TaxID=176898 RepID=A0ABP4G002_9PSEU|nr:hypothetical protein [Prauserella alba]MCP2182299.1 hypothetical protein [Prauserella alba]
MGKTVRVRAAVVVRAFVVAAFALFAWLLVTGSASASSAAPAPPPGSTVGTATPGPDSAASDDARSPELGSDTPLGDAGTVLRHADAAALDVTAEPETAPGAPEPAVGDTAAVDVPGGATDTDAATPDTATVADTATTGDAAAQDTEPAETGVAEPAPSADPGPSGSASGDSGGGLIADLSGRVVDGLTGSDGDGGLLHRVTGTVGQVDRIVHESVNRVEQTVTGTVDGVTTPLVPAPAPQPPTTPAGAEPPRTSAPTDTAPDRPATATPALTATEAPPSVTSVDAPAETATWRTSPTGQAHGDQVSHASPTGEAPSLPKPAPATSITGAYCDNGGGRTHQGVLPSTPAVGQLQAFGTASACDVDVDAVHLGLPPTAPD